VRSRADLTAYGETRRPSEHAGAAKTRPASANISSGRAASCQSRRDLQDQLERWLCGHDTKTLGALGNAFALPRYVINTGEAAYRRPDGIADVPAALLDP
jgi:hypothetical protein